MVTEKTEMFILQFTTKTSLPLLIIFGSKLKRKKGLHYNLLQKRTYFSIFGLKVYLKDLRLK